MPEEAHQDQIPPFLDALTDERRETYHSLPTDKRESIREVADANKDTNDPLRAVNQALDNFRSSQQNAEHQGGQKETESNIDPPARAPETGEQRKKKEDVARRHESEDTEKPPEETTAEQDRLLLARAAWNAETTAERTERLKREQKGKRRTKSASKTKKSETEPTADTKREKRRRKATSNKPRSRPSTKPAEATDKASDRKALEEAETTSTILGALARAGWRNCNGEECPKEHIPTEVDLCGWMATMPAEAHTAAIKRLDAVLADLKKLNEEVFFQGEDPEQYHWMWDSLGGHRLVSGLFAVEADGDLICSPVGTLESVESVHRAWLAMPDGRPDHPLAPIVESWQQRPPQVLPDQRRKGIVPQTLRGSQVFSQNVPLADHRSQIPLFPSTDLAGPVQHTYQAELPFFPVSQPGQLVPALPVQLYDQAGGALQTKGGGAPIALRLFFEALMSVRRDQRTEHQTTELTVTLRDLVDWIWPNGWNRRRNLPVLSWALKDLGELRIEWQRRLWNLVVARTLPTWETRLDDPIVLHVFSLPGSDRGPIIDRFYLRLCGLDSAPSYRSLLRIAYLWDDAKAKRGGRRVYATRPQVLRDKQDHLVDARGNLILERGRPVTNWNHPRAVHTGETERNPAADIVPELGLDDLAALGYDYDPKLTRKQISRRAENTYKALTKMEQEGAVVLEGGPLQKKFLHEGVRILEPAPARN